MELVLNKVNCLVLWFKTKLYYMKYASRYISALEYQKNIFDLIENFPQWFSEQDTTGYIFTENKKENSIDVLIGSEKFTIIASINQDGIINFKVFGWQFNLSSLTRYSHLEIDKLSFIKNGNSLFFKYNHVLDRFEEYKMMIDFNSTYTTKDIEPLFDVLEDYMHNKDRPNYSGAAFL